MSTALATTTTNVVTRKVGAALGAAMNLNAWLHRPAEDDEHRLVWYAVAAIVLFALGATILLGAIVFCDLKGMAFGAVKLKGSGTYSVGCHRW